MNAVTHPERPIRFACHGEQLFAILHPADGRVGIVVIVGGPQYRAGSHRHFVQLARMLAATGHPVLRFDARGMGDSTGTLATFEHFTPDIGSAIDALLAQQPQVRHVILWGLCDAASAALLYLHDQPDPRVTGVCLLNPWVRSQASLARTHVKHYYRQRLMQREFWAKLFSGRVARKSVRDLRQALRQARSGEEGPTSAPAAAPKPVPATFQARMAAAWKAFPGRIVLILSGNDFTAKEFVELTSRSGDWAAAFAANAPERVDITDADHTFSQPRASSATGDATLSLATRIQREVSGHRAPHGVPFC